jgi:hypothetical protein
MLLSAPMALGFQAEDISSGMRTWTSSTGKFKVEAKLLSVDGDIAKLKKEDGRIIDLPVEKLSDADIAFIEELRVKAADPDNPFNNVVSDNPFAGGAKAQDRKTPRAANGKIFVRQVLPDTSLFDSGWQVEIDAPPNTEDRQLFSKPLKKPAVGHEKVFFEMDRAKNRLLENVGCCLRKQHLFKEIENRSH